MTFGNNVLQVNTHRLTQSDFHFDVTLGRQWPWSHSWQKLLLSAHVASAWRICSRDRKFLIQSTLIFV